MEFLNLPTLGRNNMQFTPIISAILVGILQAIGWKKLVMKVAEDMLYLVAKKVDNEAVKAVSTRVADALKEAEDK